MASCFLEALRIEKKERTNTISLPSPPPSLPSSSSFPSSSLPKKGTLPMELEILQKRRWDSLESWSMLLDPANPEGFDSNSGGEREEWMADLSNLFIGNKFASGAQSRIYRGIYKQMAVAVKMVRIPDQDEQTREKLEEQFISEVVFLSRLYHPNIVQFIAACKKPPVYCIIME
ncbi:uncharacterized protein A4U43_C01F1510 [Asparagus officinalis]|uniref:non-specific serine/threonine protein kinase n=2 Tax=Asparagus officinalis TaxID=4686 RepID=A0A5P1FNF5_ASPOF|nr:uncharacterized protein A4U43_C01F1510 [Asparagus officinalis]